MSFIYITESTSTDINKFVSEISESSGPIQLDTETTGLDVFSEKVILLQVKLNNIYIFNCLTINPNVIKDIVNLINLSKRTVILHNAKFDMKFLFRYFGVMLNKVYDTMWMEVLINQGIGQKLYSLEDLVFKYCGVQLDKTVRRSFFESFNGNVTQEQLIYSAQDVEYLEHIRKQQLTSLEKAGEMKVVELENNLLPVVAEMEYNGIGLDERDWTSLSERNLEVFQKQEIDLKEYVLDRLLEKPFNNALEFADKLNIPVKSKRGRTAVEGLSNPQLIKEWASQQLNLGSPKQVLTMIKALGVDVPSTNEKVLRDYKNEHPFISNLIDYREFDKKLTTYGLGFLKNINPVTKRVHTELMNLGADSGRFSSQNPNLQNIPSFDKKTKTLEYRECFRAPEGKLLLATDYSQQEYRLAGAVTKEKVIIDAYKAGKDMHTATAALVNNKSMDEVTKIERNTAKTINFAILYGSTEYGLSFNMGIPVGEAKKIVDTFYEGYPTLNVVKKAIEDKILELRYSVTLLGRRRYWNPEPDFSTPQEIIKYRNRMKREGFNHIIQGGGADITKLALVELRKRNPFGDMFKLILQVHDEILAEISKEILKEATEFMESIMKEVEQPFLGEIPAAVESHAGERWSK
jgi:DNA polymerase-1